MDFQIPFGWILLWIRLEGWGTNEELIIQILAHRNTAQRKLIRDSYAAAYGEDLLRDLDSELTSDFQREVLLWTLSPAERDTYWLMTLPNV
ncbi:hypothetical protein H5410_026388 [Solanum commersonii]|uniref:Annexin n=1 Tax=Solanum commersonii TaxID=4109 RepID=A0A9J5YYN2_SOLCO|nr:hypothetical protein H5410_026388 [Solanum commersonii]